MKLKIADFEDVSLAVLSQTTAEIRHRVDELVSN